MGTDTTCSIQQEGLNLQSIQSFTKRTVTHMGQQSKVEKSKYSSAMVRLGTRYSQAMDLGA